MWINDCRSELSDDLTAVDAASVFLGIPRATCEGLVQNNWLATRDALVAHDRFARDPRFDSALLATLGEADLLAACQDNIPVPRVPRVYGEEIREVMDGPRVIHNYCVGCHDGPALRRDDGISVPNPVLFHDLNESQVMASLARINLPVNHEYRMPPQRSYFPAPFVIEGETVDHRQVALDYLADKLTELQSRPAPLDPVAAPSGTGCYDNAEDWLAYRDAIGVTLSEGGSANLRDVAQRLEDCRTELTDLAVDSCVTNLTKYARVNTLPWQGRRLDFEMSDFDYYQSIPQDAVSMPTAAEGIDLTGGIPANWAELTALASNVEALPYRSRTVTNPGGVGSLNRLLFLVEGDRYDKWVQFTLPEPNTNAPDADFDPTGLTDGTGPENLVDFIAIDKAQTPYKIYFAQFWRDSNGQNPRPRLRAYRDAYGMAHQPGDTDSADTCYSCHPSGTRSISPMPGSVSRDDVAILEYYNAKMEAYKQVAPLDWNGAITPSAYGPPRGKNQGCVTCHNNGGGETLAALRQGPLTSELSAGHLRHKVVQDMTMPVEQFVHNFDDASNPIRADIVVGYAQSANLLPQDLHVELAKKWIRNQRQGRSTYPLIDTLLVDFQGAGVFLRDFVTLFTADNPYLTPAEERSFDELASQQDRLLDYRQGLLGRIEDPVTQRRELGRWIQQECMVGDM